MWGQKWGDDMRPRTGRPSIHEESRTEKLNIRLTKKEKQLIEYCAEQLSVSRTDAIMSGIELLQEKFGKK